jgi:hypothetical protein|tara:strand:- start:2965 stop:3258 length:294 start_codon:yes stop_codon:yes gene_type:complete
VFDENDNWVDGYASEAIDIPNSELKGQVIEMLGDGINGIFICDRHYLDCDLNSSDRFEMISISNASGKYEIYIGEQEGQMMDMEVNDNLITITLISF